uniref:Uncharacterized protein n=1 Tax=Panagrolaimus sp. PS1159 TaxID=55785 RepID=A0AC35EYF4_9BILA
MADLYMGKYEKPATALIKILGPAIGIIKDKSDIREQAIMFGGQLGDSVIFENCETLFNRISKAYFSWNNSKKNFNDLGGKADSIRFRVTEEGFIG